MDPIGKVKQVLREVDDKIASIDFLPPPPWVGPPLPKSLPFTSKRTEAPACMSNIGEPERVHTDVPRPIPAQPIPAPIFPGPEKKPAPIPAPVFPMPERVPVRVRR